MHRGNVVNYIYATGLNPQLLIECYGETCLKVGCCGLASTLKRVDLIHIVDPLVDKPVLPSDTQYFRLHGLGRRLYSYTYTDGDLEELKRIVSELKAPECYVMFNNISMREDAQRFRRLLE